MRLEDEIKQTKPFKDEFQKLILNINVTSSYMNALFAEKLKPMGITPHQYNVLRILKGCYPESYCNQEITQRMIDKASNATRIVDKLVEKKLVSRTENAQDRRLVNIKITQQGLELLDAFNPSSSEPYASLKALGEENARLMNAWLDQLRG